MGKIRFCGECGVPALFGKDYAWHPGGVIAGKANPDLRLVVHETEAMNRVFGAVEELIGLPIEHLIVESRCRWTKLQQEESFPAWLRRAMRFATDYLTGDSLLGKTLGRPVNAVAKSFNVKVNDMGRVMGFGDITLGGTWERGEKYPHRENVIRNPYSLPLYLGDNLGATEAWEFRSMQNRYEEIGPDTYRVTTYEAEHPLELKERLRMRPLPIKPGDITYQRCPRCGVPSDISTYVWDTKEGTVTDPELGARVVFTDPLSLQAVFEDLVAELGEEVREAIIEGQRLQAKTSACANARRVQGPGFRKMLATRGFGNLTAFDLTPRGLKATIQNSALPLLMVGMLQAAFEQAAGVEGSRRAWTLSGDGDLEVSLAA